MKSISQTVHHAIAMHLDVSLGVLDDEQRLSEDLCLTPIDLVSIILEVEAAHLGSDEFPAEKLDDVETVGDLVDVFEDWASRRDTYEDIDATNIWEDRITLNP
jgi:acyl carrier protein